MKCEVKLSGDMEWDIYALMCWAFIA